MTNEARKAKDRRRAEGDVRRSSKERSSSTGEGAGILLGLLDEIALDQIVPKLPYTAFRVLALVSRPWRKAIRSGRVHKARVRANSTEKLFVFNYTNREGDRTLSRSSPLEIAPGFSFLRAQSLGNLNQDCLCTAKSFL